MTLCSQSKEESSTYSKKASRGGGSLHLEEHDIAHNTTQSILLTTREVRLVCIYWGAFYVLCSDLTVICSNVVLLSMSTVNHKTCKENMNVTVEFLFITN